MSVGAFHTWGDIIQHVSAQMNDQQFNREYRRWTRPTWMQYLNQALAEVGAYRPEAYAGEVDAPLVPGAIQSAPAGVSSVMRVAANSDGAPVKEADSGLFSAFAPYATCPPKLRFVNGLPRYRVISSAVDGKNPKTFYVSPPVPQGLSVTVKLEVVRDTPELTLADWDKPLEIDSKFLNNVVDFMMARAFQLNTESAVSQTKAQQLYQLFYQVMGVKYKIDASYKSGYYMGQTGEGDPRAMR